VRDVQCIAIARPVFISRGSWWLVFMVEGVVEEWVNGGERQVMYAWAVASSLPLRL
jgi:hypothetical protein